MKNSTKIIIGLAVVFSIILILGVFVFKWFQPKLKLVEGDGEVNRLPSGAIDESEYSTIAQTIKDNLGGLNYQNTYFLNVADILLSKNLNELRVIHNLYMRDFSSTDYPTVRSRITGEYLGTTGFGTIPTPCTSSESMVINSPCYKQKKVLEQLNKIRA